MAKRHSLARATATGTTASAAFEIVSRAAFGGIRIMEIVITLQAATASLFGLGVPAAAGVTPTLVNFVPDDDRLSFTTRAYGVASWGTPPTAPTFFFRRMSLAGAIGEKGTWTFPKGLLMPQNTTMVVWNLGTTSLADVSVIVEDN